MFSLSDWNNNKKWQNWAGYVHASPEEKRLPENIQALQNIIKTAAKEGKRVRVTGAAHSFSACAKPEEIAVSLHYLRGIIHIDQQKQEATLYAGTYLHEIGSALKPYGLALENMGDVQNQTIAGAVCTGTHGTGLTLGSVSNQVVGWKWIDGQGEIHEHRRGDDALSQALHLSLGMLGVFIELTISLVPLYGLYEESRYYSFQAALNHFDQAMHENRHMEWFLFMGSNKLQQKTLNLTPPKAMSQWQHFKDKMEGKWILNGAFYYLSEWVKKNPRQRARQAARLAAAHIPNTKRSGFSYEVFPKPRGVRFTETEYFLPYDKAQEILTTLNNELMEDSHGSHFPIEVRVQKGECGFLSPTQGKDSLILSFHIYQGIDEKPFFHWIKEKMTTWQGRPHWGKDILLEGKQLRDLYPQMDDFLQLRAQYDPQGIFLSDWFTEKFLL